MPTTTLAPVRPIELTDIQEAQSESHELSCAHRSSALNWDRSIPTSV